MGLTTVHPAAVALVAAATYDRSKLRWANPKRPGQMSSIKEVQVSQGVSQTEGLSEVRGGRLDPGSHTGRAPMLNLWGDKLNS